MEIIEDWTYECLVSNPISKFNNGFGFFIKENTAQDTIKKLRKWHKEHLDRGEPYFILDFLLEDLVAGKEIEHQVDGFHPRGIKPRYHHYKEGNIIKLSQEELEELKTFINKEK